MQVSNILNSNLEPIQLANEAIAENNIELALEILESSAKATPQNNEIYGALGRIYTQIDLHNFEIDSVIEDIYDSLIKGQYLAAQEACSVLLEKNMDLPIVYQLRSNAYLLQGKYDEAIKDAGVLITKVPDHTNGYHLLARIVADSKDDNTALNAITKLAKINPNDPFYPTLLAEINLSNNNFDLALQAIKFAHDSDLNYLNAYYVHAEILLYQGDLDNAKLLFDIAFMVEEMSEKDADLLYLSYAFYLAKVGGECDAAMKKVNKARYPVPYLMRFAEILKIRGEQKEKMNLAVERAKTINPNHPYIRRWEQ